MSWVLADGSTTVSIASVKDRCGGCAMVRRSASATKRSAAIGRQPQRRAHPRRGRVERHVEIDGLNQPVRRAVILKADRHGLLGAH